MTIPARPAVCLNLPDLASPAPQAAQGHRCPAAKRPNLLRWGWARMSARVSAWMSAWVLSLTLVACGGGGVVPTPGVDIRPLSADFTNRKAVAYSPFRSAFRDTETVTAAMIRQDLALLAPGGFTLLRVFDSSDAVSKLLLQVIADDKLDFKVMLGVYTVSESSPFLSAAVKAGNRALNLAEVARGVALAKQFSSTVVAVSIGNETMVSWSFVPTSVPLMAAHIQSVRSQITQPVTTDDNWAFFAKNSSESNDPKAVIEAIDFVSLHTYPLADSLFGDKWDWRQQAVPEAGRAVAMMDAAIAAAKSDYSAVRAHLDDLGHAAKPIVIGETGWKAVANNNEFNRAHPVNQQMYFSRLNDWLSASKAAGVGSNSGPMSIMYFEAFDEPWKAGDDKWALFNVKREARLMVQSLYPKAQFAWEVVDASICKLPLACAVSDAVFAPTVVNTVVKANRYTLYADAVTSGEAVAAPSQWFGFDSPANAFAGEGNDATLAAEGTHFMEIAPAPNPANPYGWGILADNKTSADLSQFAAAGKLNFSIKTTYPGKLMFGFLSKGGDVFLAISNTNADGYGLVNDGRWHAVSIPIAAITAGTTKFDLSRVTSAFVMDDIYATTGNTAIKGNTTKIFLDGIYWSK